MTILFFLWKNKIRGKEKVKIMILQYLAIYCIKMITGKTSYSLALFVIEYLHKNWLELGSERLDRPEKLEKAILSDDTVQSDRNIDWLTGIYLRSVQKWFKLLGYNWKEG